MRDNKHVVHIMQFETHQFHSLPLWPAHSEESEHSSHLHQSQHCSSCSWHSEDEESFLREELWPEINQKIMSVILTLYMSLMHA